MKRKLLLWSLVATIIGAIITQNWDFYLLEETLNLDFYFAQVQLPAIPNASQFLSIFLACILLASLSFLSEHYHFKRETK